VDIYCIAIGGTGMAPLAALLQKAGHTVRGSDGPLYHPMSTLLDEVGIRPHVGFDAANLASGAAPDLVIVGNAVPRTNPEAAEVERRGWPRISMPEALGRFFLAGRQPLVIAGTHGKTTTTTMAAWVYTACGADPGFLIGGRPKKLESSFRMGAGERFIIEGDEYNAAYFDRGAKFLHYRPQTLILTSAEYDHADLYPNPQALLDAFARLIALLPPDGLLIACGDWPAVRTLAADAPCPVVLYGLGADNALRPLDGIESSASGSRFQLADAEEGVVTVELSAWGEHNVSNALAVWAAARHDGLPAAAVAGALARYGGVSRRQEEIATVHGVTVIDDFAHHPTAVGKTVASLKARYPGRPIVVCYEPRSLTAGRSFLHQAYREALAAADRVYLAPIYHRGRLGAKEILDIRRLATELTAAGTPTLRCSGYDELYERALAEARDGDVMVTMSSGNFDDLPRRLAAGLETRG
jgi:UDP-N-acetylmuramate: L-alanyl-gamma-D-glutamyl-meso-diaminopimelate ligase